MASLHNPEDEPVCTELFDFSFEKLELDKRTLQRLIYEEVCWAGVGWVGGWVNVNGLSEKEGSTSLSLSLSGLCVCV
jgi:hypothetical protein